MEDWKYKYTCTIHAHAHMYAHTFCDKLVYFYKKLKKQEDDKTFVKKGHKIHKTGCIYSNY